MTYPPTPEQGGVHPPPPDPPIEAYQPPPTQTPSPFQRSGSPYPAPPPAYQPPQQQSHARPYSYNAPTGPYGQQLGTDGLAVASLVVSCVAVLGLCALWVGGLLGVIGAVLGHTARKRIRQTGQHGDGMALAGIIVGWVMTGLALIGVIFFAAVVATDS